MYVKATDGEIDQYPYDLAQLQSDNPTTCFPAVPSEQMLNSYNIYRVVVEEQPEQVSPNMAPRVKDQPELIDNVWTLRWEEFPITDEITELDNELNAANTRRDRDGRLERCDWTQLPDTPLSETQVASWASYRQQLRDVTTHENFPLLEAEEWPSEPEV